MVLEIDPEKKSQSSPGFSFTDHQTKEDADHLSFSCYQCRGFVLFCRGSPPSPGRNAGPLRFGFGTITPLRYHGFLNKAISVGAGRITAMEIKLPRFIGRFLWGRKKFENLEQRSRLTGRSSETRTGSFLGGWIEYEITGHIDRTADEKSRSVDSNLE